MALVYLTRSSIRVDVVYPVFLARFVPADSCKEGSAHHEYHRCLRWGDELFGT